MKWIKLAGLALLSVVVWAESGDDISSDLPDGIESEWFAPIDMVLSGTTAYLIGAESEQLVSYDVTTWTRRDAVHLAGRPTGMVLASDGSLYVTGGGANGKVWKVTGTHVEVFADVGHTPVAPCVDESRNRLYVCNRFDDNVAVIDLASGELIRNVQAVREPIAADLHGDWLAVANHLPEGPATAHRVSASVSVINVSTDDGIDNPIPLIDGAGALRDIKFSPDGETIYVTHNMAKHRVPTSQLERGWQTNAAVSVIDVGNQRLTATVLLDSVDRGFPNPGAMGFAGNGDYLVIASSSNHEVMLIDTDQMRRRIRATEDPERLHNDLRLLWGISRRIRLEAASNGPRALAVSDSDVYVASYFSDTVDRVTFQNDVHSRTYAFDDQVIAHSVAPEGSSGRLSVARVGEREFCDAQEAFQTWQSCLSCHPNARADGFNWDLLNDGLGNVKNTKSLLYTTTTDPSMWTGVRPTSSWAVWAGLTHIELRTDFTEVQDAILTYLNNLDPTPSPYLDRASGGLTAAAQRGAAVFDQYNCLSCHPAGSFYTDMDQKDYGAFLEEWERFKVIDTPTLIEVWRTAPYGFRGEYAKIEDFLASGHENPPSPNTREFSDLVEFILSL